MDVIYLFPEGSALTDSAAVHWLKPEVGGASVSFDAADCLLMF